MLRSNMLGSTLVAVHISKNAVYGRRGLLLVASIAMIAACSANDGNGEPISSPASSKSPRSSGSGSGSAAGSRPLSSQSPRIKNNAAKTQCPVIDIEKIASIFPSSVSLDRADYVSSSCRLFFSSAKSSINVTVAAMPSTVQDLRSIYGQLGGSVIERSDLGPKGFQATYDGGSGQTESDVVVPHGSNETFLITVMVNDPAISTSKIAAVASKIAVKTHSLHP